MRETENLEFIAVGPWGVPSPCVRTSHVYCVGKPCVGHDLRAVFCTASPSDPYHSPTAVCRAQTTVWSVCAAGSFLTSAPRERTSTCSSSPSKLSVRLPYKTPF